MRLVEEFGCLAIKVVKCIFKIFKFFIYTILKSHDSEQDLMDSTNRHRREKSHGAHP